MTMARLISRRASALLIFSPDSLTKLSSDFKHAMQFVVHGITFIRKHMESKTHIHKIGRFFRVLGTTV